MAEAFPNEQSEAELPDDSRSTISVLLLATRWQFDTYGLSTINKSLVNNLRLVDPEGETIKITCAVLEEEGKIKETDLADAKKYGVQLKGAIRPRCKRRSKKPELEWLDESSAAYYLHLAQDQHYDFTVGHAPYLANGCLNLKGLFQNKNQSTKAILMFHGLPKDENGYIDDEMLMDWLAEADIALSLGKTVEEELLPYIAALDPENRPIHKLYLPSYPLELFGLKQDNVQNTRSTQIVSIMSGEIKDLDINGLDFPLAVTAAAGASEHIRDFDGVRMRLSLLAAEEEEKANWKENFEEVLQGPNLKDTGLSFQAEAPLTLDNMKIHLRKSNLFLLPLRQDTPLFGTEALSAIAAGVPVLISRDSGLASLLKTMVADESVVHRNKLQLDAQSWKERIIQKLVRPEETHIAAKTLREQLLLDTSIAQTHLDFINTIAGIFNKMFIVYSQYTQ